MPQIQNQNYSHSIMYFYQLIFSIKAEIIFLEHAEKNPSATTIDNLVDDRDRILAILSKNERCEITVCFNFLKFLITPLNLINSG